MTNPWIKVATTFIRASFCSFVLKWLSGTSLTDEVLLGQPKGRLWGAQVVLKSHQSRWASLLFIFTVCKIIWSKSNILHTKSAQVPDCTLSVVSSVTATVNDSQKKKKRKKPDEVWAGFWTQGIKEYDTSSQKKSPLWTLIWQAVNIDL